jgi:hypothetical protein
MLHHLLPKLVFPIDNEYTATFFGWDNFVHDPEGRFAAVFCQIARIARLVNPQSYVAAQGWNSSSAKVLDNAIIGYYLVTGLRSRSKEWRQQDRRRKRELIEAYRRWKAGTAN